MKRLGLYLEDYQRTLTIYSNYPNAMMKARPSIPMSLNQSETNLSNVDQISVFQNNLDGLGSAASKRGLNNTITSGGNFQPDANQQTMYSAGQSGLL